MNKSELSQRKIYTDLSEFGQTKGTESYQAIIDAMGNNSEFWYNVDSNSNRNETPNNYPMGFVEFKKLRSLRAIVEFTTIETNNHRKFIKHIDPIMACPSGKK